MKKLSFVNCPKLFSLRTACSTVNTLDQGAVGTLDVSAWKVMNNYVRKRQITNEYTLHKGKNGVPKKLVINKKLRKADKKWIKKLAKKWKIKVVEK